MSDEKIGEIVVAMPGTIIKVHYKVGDAIEKDNEVAVLESMKMNNPIFSSVSGKITEILVAEGSFVATNEVIARISISSSERE